MKNIKILDCTLRDGGRIINCEFPNDEIKDISYRLAKSKIDVVEIGFLRDPKIVEYNGNSTFFTDVDQIIPFVDRTKSTKYVAFVDYELYDFDTLKPFDGTSIDGIRVGWKKSSFANKKQEIIRCLKRVKELGYMLYIQGVNTLGYTDRDLLDILDFVNEIHPNGFGIVDTYGAMYVDDVERIYTMVDHNLDSDIAIDFHSHNNYQLSFAFAQEIIRLSNGKREILIDGTLNGMGKVAGNLCTELIVDYLVRKRNYDYDFDAILDIIDDYVYPYMLKHKWGYSVPALMAGIYKSHPNNVIYLTEKFRLATKDIKHIMSMIDPIKRMSYDYDNIQRLYQEYVDLKIDDSKAIDCLKKQLENRKILLLMPGSSITDNRDRLINYIKENDAIVIMVNFVDTEFMKTECLCFWGSNKRYEKYKELRKDVFSIVTSNVKSDNNSDIMVNYDSYINRNEEYSDNTSLMLIRLLIHIGIKSFDIAGFDGFSEKGSYCNSSVINEGRFISKYSEINKAIAGHLKNIAETIGNTSGIHFLTPSIYKPIFEK